MGRSQSRLLRGGSVRHSLAHGKTHRYLLPQILEVQFVQMLPYLLAVLLRAPPASLSASEFPRQGASTSLFVTYTKLLNHALELLFYQQCRGGCRSSWEVRCHVPFLQESPGLLMGSVGWVGEMPALPSPGQRCAMVSPAPVPSLQKPFLQRVTNFQPSFV